MQCIKIVGLFGLLSGSSLANPASFQEEQMQCEQGNAMACNAYGISLIKGWHSGAKVPQDVNRGLEILDSACNAEIHESCYWLAQILYDGSYAIIADLVTDKSEHEAPQDPKRAIPLYQKSCKGGYNHSCFILGELYEKGEFVETDYKQSILLYEKSCPTNETACSSIKRVKQLLKFNNIKVSLGGVSLMGDVDGSLMDAVFVRSFQAINQCYNKLLKKTPERSGEIKVQFKLQRGAMRNPQIKNSSFNDAQLENCTLEAIQGLDISSLKTKMTIVQYKLLFKP